MSVAPELGTRPRPDVTGTGKYSNADVELGINPMKLGTDLAIDYWVGWGALEIKFDFNELKYAPTGYEVELSRYSDFEAEVPMAERKGTGLSGFPVAGQFFQGVVSINPYNGDPSLPLQPDTQYYARVRAVLADGPSEWSETLGCSTKTLPAANGLQERGNGYLENLGPVAAVDVVVAGTVITITDTSTVGPVNASPLYDVRFTLTPLGGEVRTELPGGVAVFDVSGATPGTYNLTVASYVTDENGYTSLVGEDITVVVP